MNVLVAEALITHARLEREGYLLRTLRFDGTRPKGECIVVRMVWRRPSDRSAEVWQLRITRSQADLLLAGLGGVQAL